MCHQASITLPPDRAAPRQARRELSGWLERWGVTGDAVDSALLLVTEAVTNATVHAGTSSTLSVGLRADRLQLSVADGCPADTSDDDATVSEAPRLEPRRAAPTDESGRGLALIDALAEEWDVVAAAGGKQVRMWLPVERLPDARAACSCR